MAGKRLSWLIVLLVWGFVLSPLASARAENLHSIEDEPPQAIMEGMAGKAARGVANTATGWLELPKQIYVTWNEDGAGRGLSVGPLKGIGMAVVRTVTGACDLATFFLPFPGFYDPYFEPEYVWERE